MKKYIIATTLGLSFAINGLAQSGEKKPQEKGKPKAAAERKTAEGAARPDRGAQRPDRGAQRPQRGTTRQAARPNAPKPPKIVYHLEKWFGAKAENEGIPLEVAASLLKRLDNNKDGKLTRKELFHD